MPRAAAVSVCVLDIAVSCVETAEPLELPFALWTRAGSTNRVLGGGGARILPPPVEGTVFMWQYPTCIWRMHPVVSSMTEKSEVCTERAGGAGVCTA